VGVCFLNPRTYAVELPRLKVESYDGETEAPLLTQQSGAQVKCEYRESNSSCETAIFGGNGGSPA